MSLYRKILSQAWKITWHNKYLWFFGLFAALLGNGGEYEILARGLRGESGQSLFPSLNNIIATGVFSKRTLSNIGDLILTNPSSLIMILVIGLTILSLIGFLIWLTIVSQIAIVNNSFRITAGKRGDFKDGVFVGVRKFWPVLGLNILIKLVIFVAFLLISLPLTSVLMSQTETISANLFYVLAFIIFVPVAIALSFMIKYAIAYVVIKGNYFTEAVRAGWKLFVQNWLISIEMAFILFFINFIVGLAVVLSILILAIPFLFLAFVFYYFISILFFWVIIIIALICFFMIILLGGSLLATFQISSWTSLFIELIGRGGTSKIARIMSKVMK